MLIMRIIPGGGGGGGGGPWPAVEVSQADTHTALDTKQRRRGEGGGMIISNIFQYHFITVLIKGFMC